MSRALIGRYAEAALDFNELHLSDEAAQAAGLARGVILHGMCTLAWLAEAVEEAAGERLCALSCRFALPLHSGDAVRFEIFPDEAERRWRGRARTPSGVEVLKAIRAHTGPPPPLTEALTHLDDQAPLQRARYTVDRSKIRAFRDAIEVPGSGDEAPFTFAAVVCRGPVFELLRHPDIRMPTSGILHGAQSLNGTRPLRHGETVETIAGLRSDRTRAGLRRVVVRSVTRDASGAPVSAADWTLLERSAQASSPPVSAGGDRAGSGAGPAGE